MALASWQATIVDDSGNIQPNAEITVLREAPGQPPAQCFSDRAGLNAIGSTFNSDADGFVRFHAAGGSYQITATLGAFLRTWRYVAIGTAAETDAGSIVSAIQPSAWIFASSTTDADPGDGRFRLNHATPASATAAFVDNENAGAMDVSAWLNTLDDSGDSTNRGVLTIFDPDAPTDVFRAYTVSGSVVDGTGYRKLTLTHIAGAGSFAADGTYTFSFSARGPTGPQGIQGIQGIQGEQGPQGVQGPPGEDGEVPASRSITAGAGLTGGGSLAADRTIDVGAGTGILANANDVAIDKASNANVRSAAADKVLTSDLIESASAGVAITNQTPATWDWDAAINFTLTISQNTQIATPSNGQPGTWRTILVQGNDATDRTITFSGDYEGDIPTITDCDNGRWYLLLIYCVSASHFVVSAKKANGT